MIQPNKSKKPSIILSFLIVILTFSSVLAYSFIAKANPTYWNIDHESDEEWINIDAFGMVSENMMAISMHKERCNELDVDFYFTSYATNRADDGFKFALEVIEKPYNGEDYINYEEELFVAYSEQRGERTFYLLDDGYLYDTERWLKALEDLTPFAQKIILKKHNDPEYDIDTSSLMTDVDEVWDMTELPNILARVYQECRFKNFNEIDL
tara:strand:+ start:454 stop:1083 length:630 start_codon:yes stop_codon:yes gene_type:complete